MNRAPYQNIGKIHSSQGMVYEATLPRAVMGCGVEFVTQTGETSYGEVVGIRGERVRLCLMTILLELILRLKSILKI